MVQRTVTIVRKCEVTWTPPPVQVSAAPQKTAATPVLVEPRKPMASRARGWLVAAGIGMLFAMCTFAPPPLPQHFLG